jgi:hypothetical protein
LEESHHFLAAQEGQNEIEDEKVVGDRLQKLDRRRATLHELDDEPFSLEHAAHKEDDRVVIFNHKRSKGAAPICRRIIDAQGAGFEGRNLAI